MNRNWLGFSKNIYNFENYRSIRIAKNKSVKELLEKGHLQKYFKYIGMAGIKDYKIFWKI